MGLRKHRRGRSHEDGEDGPGARCEVPEAVEEADEYIYTEEGEEEEIIEDALSSTTGLVMALHGVFGSPSRLVSEGCWM